MKINRQFYKLLIIASLSLFAVYLVALGEFIVSSALFCTAFVVSNVFNSDSVQT